MNVANSLAAQAEDREPARAARIRIAQLVTSIVAVGAFTLGAMAANDAFDADSQWLPMLRGPAQTVTIAFGLCGPAGSGENCVLDGDAFLYRGQRLSVAGIDAPRRADADCPAEAALGESASRKLQALLNAGPFETLRIPTKALRIRLVALRRDGEYFADRLIDAGLARRRILFRRSWCS